MKKEVSIDLDSEYLEDVNIQTLIDYLEDVKKMYGENSKINIESDYDSHNISFNLKYLREKNEEELVNEERTKFATKVYLKKNDLPRFIDSENFNDKVEEIRTLSKIVKLYDIILFNLNEIKTYNYYGKQSEIEKLIKENEEIKFEIDLLKINI